MDKETKVNKIIQNIIQNEVWALVFSIVVGIFVSWIKTFQAFQPSQGVEKTFGDFLRTFIQQDFYLAVSFCAIIYIVTSIIRKKIHIQEIKNSENEIIDRTNEIIKKTEEAITEVKETMENHGETIKTINEQYKELLGFRKRKDEFKEAKKEVNIKSLLEHLAKDYYGRCSDGTRECVNCPKFSKQCDGLFRSYLLNDCSYLCKQIESTTKRGNYVLQTNIEQYHEMAIKHMLTLKCRDYSVIQWIGNQDMKKELYDSLDYHFLSELLEALTDTAAFEQGVTSVPYYRQTLDERGTTFKIKWLFVGNAKYIKNNFDYIFFVIEEAGLEDTVKEFFEFYSISEYEYKRKRTSRPFLETYLDIDTPSIGIFGDKFVFVDAPSKLSKQGDIYSNTDSVKIAEQIHDFFESDLSKKVKLEFDTLLNEYKKLANKDGTSEQREWYNELLARREITKEKDEDEEGGLTA
jgi:hypothetical protein